MVYMDVQTAAKKWGLTPQRITTLCRDGRIEGAVKKNGLWQIPESTPQPVDGRRKKTARSVSARKLPFPIGVSSYTDAVSNYYYVDKTLLIRDFLDAIPKVSLFTRPRRFGKTLNMDMLKTFFEISTEDTSRYFKDKLIWGCGEKYRRHQGAYPVIFLSLKDTKYNTWEKAFKDISDALAQEFARHGELAESDRCDALDKAYYDSVVKRQADEVSLAKALAVLSRMLYKHYGQKTVIIIDEYDTPISQGYIDGYYEQIIAFIRNLFSGAFKDNSYLAYGFLTGILRVAKESIFSGLNNLKELSVLDDQFNEYFGFTKEEMKEMLAYYGRSEKEKEICEWYDGYRFGNADIYNPWSVICYLGNNCTARAYWQSTGSNTIISDIVQNADTDTKEKLQALMRGDSVFTNVDSSIIYPEIRKEPSSIFSFLLMTGYLKPDKVEKWQGGELCCSVKIPNKEIAGIYEKEILSGVADIIPQSSAMAIRQAILKKDPEELKAQLERFLRQTISTFDTSYEGFYHGWLLGIYAIMNNLYKVASNRESGDGRYDIGLTPTSRNMPAILIEIKVLRKEDAKAADLQKLAKEALCQINEKDYAAEFKQSGVKQIVKYGIAFHRKRVELCSETETL